MEQGERARRRCKLISALPDDMLVEILALLRCPGAAARTGILSRSWRGLWTRLPVHVFRGVALGSIQAALDSIKAEGGPGASVPPLLLDISVPEASFSETELSERVPKLLDAAAALSPVELRLAVWENTPFKYVKVVVPRLPCAASLELQGLDLAFADADQPRSWQGFPALERLSLTSCRAVLTNLLPRCPRLRVFRASGSGMIFLSVNTRTSSSNPRRCRSWMWRAGSPSCTASTSRHLRSSDWPCPSPAATKSLCGRPFRRQCWTRSHGAAAIPLCLPGLVCPSDLALGASCL